MQNWVWKLLLALVIVFFAGPILSTALTLLALASPPVANLAFCPPGSTANIHPDPFASTTQVFAIVCHAPSGPAKVGFSETDIWTLERGYFHAASYIVVALLVVAWYLWSWIHKWLESRSNAV